MGRRNDEAASLQVLRHQPRQQGLRIGVFAGVVGALLVWTLLVSMYVMYAPTLPAFNAITDYQPKIGTRLYSADNQLIAALVAAGEGIALLPRYTTDEGGGLALRPLLDVPSARWVVALSRRDRAERAAVRLVARTLAEVGAAVAV